MTTPPSGPQDPAESGPQRGEEPQPHGQVDPSLTTELFVDGVRKGGSGDPAGQSEESAEGTALLSLEELRQIAKETHIPQLDETRQTSHARPEVPVASQPARPVTWPMNQGAGIPPRPPQPPHVAPQHSSRPVLAPGMPAAVPPAWNAPAPAGPPPAQPPTPAAPGRRRRGAWWIVLAILAVLLLVAAVVFGAMYLGSREAQSQPAPPVPAEQQEDPTAGSEGTGEGDSQDAGGTSLEGEWFTSPSGNITCVLNEDAASCQIGEFSYQPPSQPDDCDWNGYGSVVTVGGERAEYGCFPVVGGTTGAPALDYGEEVTAGDLTCTSTEQGMRCEHAGGHGFQIARAAASFFP
ncbi:DUF6479 family protein [Sediminivirga luteola]|uniref:Uncharacterized protein n=1 Tax=Sediminivirga luteola TaxID=1774748 RepID=A0A8J2TWI7_9MICO|nr:DUF6636 domain-containing protein [Sediminivirga luteola]GGA08476.1 hypothetical protein GCM10011333_09220 [Sediminivirga luteola]